MKSIVQVFTFDIVAKVMMGLTGILMIRYMAPAEFARYTVAVAVAGTAAQVLTTAVNRVYIVGGERVPVRDPLHAMLGFQLVAIAVGAVMAGPALAAEPLLGGLVVALVMGMCLAEFAKTYYQRDLRFLPFSMIEVGRAAAFTAAMLLLAHSAGVQMRAWQVLLLQVVTTMAVFALSMGRVVRWSRLADVGDAAGMLRAMLRGAYRALFAYFVVQSVLSQLNIGMLRLLSDDLALASYGSAYRYYALILLSLAAVDKVLLPYAQRATSADDLRRVLGQTLRFAAAVAGPVLLGAYLARWVLPALDMGKYPTAVPAFQILAVSAVVSLAFSPYANLLMRYEEFAFLFGIVSLAAALNVALGVPLILRHGAAGASAAYVAALAVMNVAIFLRARRVVRLRPLAPAASVP